MIRYLVNTTIMVLTDKGGRTDLSIVNYVIAESRCQPSSYISKIVCRTDARRALQNNEKNWCVLIYSS